ncbi:glycosyl transferase family 41-domain-containing protein [Hyaloraphidium curvatum]|nr:glycosyl transferase family 41-domain-containing protein [Hyaloraphidium curvatum]
MPVSQAELVAASERFYRRAVAIRPRYWDAAVNLAGLLSSQGRFAEAVEVYADLEAAMEKTVEPADRLAGLEVVGSGDLADRAYVLAVQDAERRRAERERASGKPPGTHRSSWDNLETRRDLYYAKGNLLYVVGSAAEAKKEYLKALVVSGIDVVRVMNSCHPGILPAPPVSPAQVLARKEGSPSKRGAAAQQAAATSLMMQTLAKIYQDAGMLHFAVAFYYLSLSLHPVANSCNNLGIILSSQRLDEAIAWYEVGLRLDPNHPHVLTNLGSALKDRGMVQEGIACYRRAIAIQPDFYIALANLANVYKDQGRVDDAIGLYRRALACKPDFVEAFCNYVNSLLFVCDWTDRDENLVRISHVVNEQLRAARRQNPVSIPTVLPFHTFTYASLTAYQVREISRCNAERILWNVTSSAWFPGFPQRPADVASSALAALPSVSRGSESWNSFTEALRRLASTAVHFPFPRPPPPMPDPRLRIGYVSSDIKDHPLSHLMQSVFGMHDRSRFMVVCYALSKPDDSTYSRKVAGECERFVDASSMSVQDIVAEIARDGIHILVNLNGYTKGGRNEIFAARPAPLSMQFMGFAGTMGAGPVLDEVAPAGVQPSPGDAAAVDPDPDLAFFDTMRERWIDYFVADEIALPRRTVVGEPRDIEVEQVLQGGFLPPPPTHKRRNATDTNRVYTENVVYLPHSYFVNDHRQGFRDLQDDEVEKLVPDLVRLAGTARPPASDFADGEDHLSPGDWVQWTKEQFLRLKMRQELFPGIREDTVIFANMNQSYKVDPHIFETWLNILRRVPNSVLWLLRFPPAAEKHLKRWAVGRAGEAVADRILFTDVAPKHLHIQRGRVADIFLDTPECNAHTTAADILWSGTPLVTFPKYEFKMCSRVAASVAYATGSWDAADSPVMLSELCSIDKDATTSDVAELAQKIARSKAKAVTGTGDLDWWTRSPAARELRNGQGSRVETLQNPNLLGHLMVCTSYKEYEERAVRFAAGVQWRWKDIRGCPTVPQVDGGGVDRFFPDRAAPTHIYTPSGPLVRLRRQLFLTRDKIPLFDTARWVRDVERCMLLCWERFEHGWRKVRERNAREFGGLAEAGLDIGSLELPAKRRRQPSGASEETLDGSRNGFRLLGGGAAALRSRCLWIENEDWDGQKTMG